jgi:hypothetical protein
MHARLDRTFKYRQQKLHINYVLASKPKALIAITPPLKHHFSSSPMMIHSLIH